MLVNDDAGLKIRTVSRLNQHQQGLWPLLKLSGLFNQRRCKINLVVSSPKRIRVAVCHLSKLRFIRTWSDDVVFKTSTGTNASM